MAISKGAEMMIMSLVKMLGIDPQLLMSAVENINKSLHSAASDMATIRRQNSAIMAHLGIAEPLTGDLNNERSGDLNDGQSGGTGPHLNGTGH